MSLYNHIFGFNPSVFLILPMLGKHPDEYPRFRDCFIEDGKIIVYTRSGGLNREDYGTEHAELMQMKEYIRDYDDEWDSTYAFFEFEVPDKWREDYKKITEGKFDKVSDEYVAEINKMYPEYSKKINSLFKRRKKRKKKGE